MEIKKRIMLVEKNKIQDKRLVAVRVVLLAETWSSLQLGAELLSSVENEAEWNRITKNIEFDEDGWVSNRGLKKSGKRIFLEEIDRLSISSENETIHCYTGDRQLVISLVTSLANIIGLPLCILDMQNLSSAINENAPDESIVTIPFRFTQNHRDYTEGSEKFRRTNSDWLRLMERDPENRSRRRSRLVEALISLERVKHGVIAQEFKPILDSLDSGCDLHFELEQSISELSRLVESKFERILLITGMPENADGKIAFVVDVILKHKHMNELGVDLPKNTWIIPFAYREGAKNYYSATLSRVGPD